MSICLHHTSGRWGFSARGGYSSYAWGRPIDSRPRRRDRSRLRITEEFGSVSDRPNGWVAVSREPINFRQGQRALCYRRSVNRPADSRKMFDWYDCPVFPPCLWREAGFQSIVYGAPESAKCLVMWSGALRDMPLVDMATWPMVSVATIVFSWVYRPCEVRMSESGLGLSAARIQEPCSRAVFTLCPAGLNDSLATGT